MNIKLKPIDIADENPFLHDALGREESAKILTQFIKNLDEPYVIAIDSPWGTGKTTFLKMWQAYLNKNKIHSIYFNAWESDFNDDALIALIKEIEIHLSDLELTNEKRRDAKKYLNKAKKFGYKLLKKSVPAAVKLATYGILDTSAITESTISSITEDIAKEQFSAYENSKKSLNNFRDSLEKFSEKISDDSPLIFIVDELDRCRPNYAIQVLEKIKHLFSIKNIIFVLGIDKEQIGYSIESLYGKGMDVPGYLSRFIDLDYHLPKPNKKDFIKFTLKRHNLEVFFNSRQQYPNLKYDEEVIINSLSELFHLFKFSLRDIEQLISQLMIVIKVTKENEFLHPSFLCFLLALRKKRMDLYIKLKDYSISPDELIKKLQLKSYFSDFYEQQIRGFLEFSFAYVKRDSDDIKKKYKDIINDENMTEELKGDASSMLNFFQHLSFRHSGNIIDFLVERIEISYRFE